MLRAGAGAPGAAAAGAQAIALRLTDLEGLSLRAAAAKLQMSPMAVRRAHGKELSALRQQLVGAD